MQKLQEKEIQNRSKTKDGKPLNRSKADAGNKNSINTRRPSRRKAGRIEARGRSRPLFFLFFFFSQHRNRRPAAAAWQIGHCPTLFSETPNGMPSASHSGTSCGRRRQRRLTAPAALTADGRAQADGLLVLLVILSLSFWSDFQNAIAGRKRRFSAEQGCFRVSPEFAGFAVAWLGSTRVVLAVPPAVTSRPWSFRGFNGEELSQNCPIQAGTQGGHCSGHDAGQIRF
ncbi:hypothetical protein B0H67DRAFT_122393 [Lasiosphaeris hirsuta]|uniref:Uncharacterized protein n=1 Tax=Lasiosphaeris hirsuta TaxID=260670 RepID=A0AA40AZY8_9PEZI|nr:hypothetical protein B0H67DRAFT_122393 [Lasiosphaeris hirsuta]